MGLSQQMSSVNTFKLHYCDHLTETSNASNMLSLHLYDTRFVIRLLRDEDLASLIVFIKFQVSYLEETVVNTKAFLHHIGPIETNILDNEIYVIKSNLI